MEGRGIIWCGGGGELKGRSDLAQTCKKTPEAYCGQDSLACAGVWGCWLLTTFLPCLVLRLVHLAFGSREHISSSQS